MQAHDVSRKHKKTPRIEILKIMKPKLVVTGNNLISQTWLRGYKKRFTSADWVSSHKKGVLQKSAL